MFCIYETFEMYYTKLVERMQYLKKRKEYHDAHISLIRLQPRHR